MVFVTSDLHGDLSRLKSREMKRVKRGDTVIVLGDFGFLWQGGEKEQRVLKKLGRQRYSLLFLDGCHENFDLLRNYETVEFMGGNAKQIDGKLHYLLKGEIYEIENKKILCFGGGESEERDPAYEGERWWRAELPTEIEMRVCAANLQKHSARVDYVLSHEAPGRLLRFMNQEVDQIGWFQAFLDKLMDKVEYKKWLFGRYHRDLAISPKAEAVYKNLVPLG